MQFKCIMVTQALILLICCALGENLTNNRDTKSGKNTLIRTLEGQCDAGWYKDSSTDSCLKCDNNCKTCINSSTKCTSCADNLTLDKEFKCYASQLFPQSKCKTGEFYVSSTETCSKCVNYCINCNNNNSCVQCESSDLEFISESNSCECKIPHSFYDSDNRICKECGSHCIKCENLDKCITCESDQLANFNGICICKKGMFYNKYSKACEQCSSECEECVGENDFCTLCKNSDSIPINGLCGCKDPNMQVDSDGKCVCKTNFYETGELTCMKICPEFEIYKSKAQNTIKISK